MKNPKHILITGASSGIGQGLALYYAAQEGVHLYLNGRDEARLATTVRLCEEKGALVQGRVVDVTDQDAMRTWVSEFDRLDLVIANAGISGGTGGGKNKGSGNGEPIAQVRKIFDVNIMGMLNTLDPALEKMRENEYGDNNKIKGQVAVLSSMAGFRGWPSAPAYSASKGCVRFYGEALRGVLKESGIAVNVICPGFVTSRITDANDFPMPMKLEPDKAAQIIARGLAKNKGRICFPWPVHFISWFIGALPDVLAQYVLSKAPTKNSL